MSKLCIMVLVIVGPAIGGFFLFNQYIYTQKQAPSNTVVSYRGTLSGEYLCLPYKNADPVRNTTCDFGIKTDGGEYYAVDFSLMSQERPALVVGERFTANGTITPIELLSTDYWQQYSIEGIFSVTDSVAKL